MKKTLAILSLSCLLTQAAFASSGQGTNEQVDGTIHLDLVDEGESADQSDGITVQTDQTAQSTAQSAVGGAYSWVVDLIGQVVGEQYKKPASLLLGVAVAATGVYAKVYGNPFKQSTAQTAPEQKSK